MDICPATHGGRQRRGTEPGREDHGGTDVDRAEQPAAPVPPGNGAERGQGRDPHAEQGCEDEQAGRTDRERRERGEHRIAESGAQLCVDAGLHREQHADEERREDEHRHQ
jgi:hypothetical protein